VTPDWRAVVIGIGNPFRHDDGLGPAVVELLRRRTLPASVTLADCDGEPTRLLDLWQGMSLAIVVDAMRGSAGPDAIPVPGRVCRRSLRHPSVANVPHTSGGSASSHGVNLSTAVSLAAALDSLPTTLLLYAVEVTDTTPGQGLSPDVAAAAEAVAVEIVAVLNRHPDSLP
jgi:hydrogenase maturation protease